MRYLIRMAVCAAIMLSSVAAFAQQSNNHVLHAVPPPGDVVIDGVLDDWDLSGQFEVYANYRMRNTYSTRVAAMYDAEYFYLSVQWRDPTPLFNMIDARFDIGSGWRSDCLQLRVKTDVVMHIDCWYSTAAEQPVIRINYGSFRHDSRMHSRTLEDIDDAIAAGAKQAFTKGEDGRSYTQELAIPWKLLTGASAIVRETGQPYSEGKTFSAGDSFNMGMEFLWGGPDGETWPVHRYADLLAEGRTSREFFWTAEDAWGPVKLMPEGNLELPEVEIAGLDGYLQKTDGPVEIRYEMPFDGFATIVIEDENGFRVRNLVGMAPRSQGVVVDHWDGTDDEGQLVAPGNYSWRGLIHAGIDAVYEASFGTPGNPPWDTADGTGAWMSDHAAPIDVAAGQNMMVLAAGGAEAGYGVVGTDLNGKKRWGQRRFHDATAVAADARHAFVAEGGTWGNHKPGVGRLDLRTGRYAPFETKPEPQLMLDPLKEGEDATVLGIAVHGDRLAVALGKLNLVRFFHSRTGEPLGEVAVDRPGHLAYDAAGNLYALSAGKVVKIAGDVVNVVVDANIDPRGITVDAEGRIYLSDRSSHQVKVFDGTGQLLRTVGTEGGRPRPGLWDPQGMHNPNGLAVDGQGRLWVAESDMIPKRISVWNDEGKLEVDYIGPTTYGGMGAFVDSQDKTRVFGMGCEWRLDYEKNKAEVVAVALPEQVTGDLVRYGDHEYVMNRRQVLYVRKGDVFQPAVRFGRAGREGSNLGNGVRVPANLNFLWADLNADGQVQENEVITRQGGIPWTVGYWGGYWLDDNLNIAIGTGGYGSRQVLRIPRTGMTETGVPIYDVDNLQIYHNEPTIRSGGARGTGPEAMYLTDGDNIIFGTNPITCVRPDGQIVWTYPNHWGHVHGSHNAPIPPDDATLIGTLACIGVADTGTDIGRIWATNSNMGRLYIMTADGLHIASVFQDNRTGADSWPNEAKAGSPLGGVTMGSEWFGGYFFRSEPTDEYYLIAGFTSFNMIRLDGFNTLQPLNGAAFEFTGEHLIAAQELLQQRAARAAAANDIKIVKLAEAPAIDGSLNKYPADAFVEWSAAAQRARGAVATDGTDLILAFEVFGDNNPMVNAGQDFTQLFVTGDSVDIQLGTNPNAADRSGPAVGDLRLLISVFNNEPIAVLYRWKVEGDKNPVIFRSPWRDETVDSVEMVKDARIHISRHGNRYIVEAAVPLAALGFDPQPGKEYKLDLGVIYSDATGTNRASRVYWANKATGLTSDVPGEIMAHPNLWGTATLAE